MEQAQDIVVERRLALAADQRPPAWSPVQPCVQLVAVDAATRTVRFQPVP